MTLDQILDNHLPDNGLCDRLKRANQQRKRKIKADIEVLMRENQKAVYSAGFRQGGTSLPWPDKDEPVVPQIVLDEQQLEPPIAPSDRFLREGEIPKS